MSKKPDVVLGDGARGDLDNPGKVAAVQPGLVDAPETQETKSNKKENSDG